MELIIDIPDYTYEAVKEYVKEGLFDYDGINATLHKSVANGTPLDDLRDKIEEIEINGHIRDVECFRAGINIALNVIDKYKAESEERK